jgi:N-terminal acetyltransferase B complex non-catalytic subunit
MSILDYTFVEPSQLSERIADTMNLFQEVATNDGAKDRSGLLALLELEKRCRAHSASDGQSYLNRV